jgi:MFS transporter, DHA1 family, multidrug resistance protein
MRRTEPIDLNEPPLIHWRRTLWAMLSVQFIVSGAFSIVPPVIPLVLPLLGIHAPGAVRTWAGILVGVTPLAAALMSPQWGRMLDRIDSRLIILISCAAAALCTASMSLATNAWELLGLRFIMGLFGGHVAAGLFIVSTATPTSRLGWALGWLATAQLAGTLLGPLIGGGIADAFASLRAPFLLAGAAVILVGAAVAVVPATGLRPRRSGSRADRAQRSPRIPQQHDVRNLVAVLLLAQCAIMMTQPVISLHVRELVGERANLTTLAGLAFSVVGLGGLLAAPMLGTLGDRVGATRLLFWVVVAAATCVLPQAFASSYSGFVAERFLAGIPLCSAIPLVNALVAKSVPADNRGQALGLTSGAAFMGAFIGPVSGGLLGAHFGLITVFVVSGGILLINALWIGVTLWPGRRAAPLCNS